MQNELFQRWDRERPPEIQSLVAPHVRGLDTTVGDVAKIFAKICNPFDADQMVAFVGGGLDADLNPTDGNKGSPLFPPCDTESWRKIVDRIFSLQSRLEKYFEGIDTRDRLKDKSLFRTRADVPRFFPHIQEPTNAQIMSIVAEVKEKFTMDDETRLKKIEPLTREIQVLEEEIKRLWESILSVQDTLPYPVQQILQDEGFRDWLTRYESASLEQDWWRKSLHQTYPHLSRFLTFLEGQGDGDISAYKRTLDSWKSDLFLIVELEYEKRNLISKRSVVETGISVELQEVYDEMVRRGGNPDLLKKTIVPGDDNKLLGADFFEKRAWGRDLDNFWHNDWVRYVIDTVVAEVFVQVHASLQRNPNNEWGSLDEIEGDLRELLFPQDKEEEEV